MTGLVSVVGEPPAGSSQRRRPSVTSPRWLAAIVVAGTVLAGCGGGTPTAAGPTPTPARPTVTLAVLVPLTGPQAAAGRGALGAVQATVDARVEELSELGLAVDVIAYDDRGQQSVGQQQATTAADDAAVVAVVGSTSSSLDEGVQPILGEAGVPQLSLGGSDSALTRRGDKRPFPSYVTYAARALDRAAVAASTGVSDGDRIAILHGDRRTDEVMAVSYASRVTAAGGRVVLDRVVPTTATESDEDDVARAALRSALAAADPDVVYAVLPEGELWDTVSDVRTVAPRSTLLLDEAALGRWSQPLDEQRAAALDRGTVWGPLLAAATGAETKVSADAAGSTSPTPSADPLDEAEREPAGGRFAAAAADATQLVLDSLVATMADSGDVPPSVPELRDAVLEALDSGETHEGIPGAYSFDRFGVASVRLVGVYERVGESWRQRRAAVVDGTCRVATGCSVGSLRR